MSRRFADANAVVGAQLSTSRRNIYVVSIDLENNFFLAKRSKIVLWCNHTSVDGAAVGDHMPLML